MPRTEAAMIALVRDNISTQYTDYPGLRVKSAHMVANDFAIQVCLLANARNPMGGYNGYHWDLYIFDLHEHLNEVVADMPTNCGDLMTGYMGGKDYVLDFAPDHRRAD